MQLSEMDKVRVSQLVEEVHAEVRTADARLRILTTMIGVNVGLTLGMLIYLMTL